MEDNFSRDWGSGEWLQDDSSALHQLCILFLFCGDLRIFYLDFRDRVCALSNCENLMLLLIYQEV